MKILISNDDGIDAPGLAFLERAAALLSDDVWTIAPEGNRSGYGHSITLRQSFRVERRAPRRFACSGTPADCVIAAMQWVFEASEKPDLILSGINEGRNVAEDVAYSGTMAVAREAALVGIPGIAFSMPRDADPIEGVGLRWLADRIENLWLARSEWAHEGHWLSVNLPRQLPAPLRAAQIGRDKVAKRAIIHRQDANSADIEPLADRDYAAQAGDENSFVDGGIASLTLLHWMGHNSVPESLLWERAPVVHSA